MAAYNARTGQLEWEYSPRLIRTMGTSFDDQVFECFDFDEHYLAGAVFDSSDNTLYASKVIENPSGLQSDHFTVPLATSEDGMGFVGIVNRVVGFDFTKDEPTVSISDPLDFEVVSIDLVQDTIVTSSAPQFNNDAGTWDSLEREYHFECLDSEMNTLWTYDGTWKPKLDGAGPDQRLGIGNPKACGATTPDGVYAICTVGDTLLSFDNSNGELLHSEQFGSTIVSAGIINRQESESGDTIAVVCANGSTYFRHMLPETNDRVQDFNFFRSVRRDAISSALTPAYHRCTILHDKCNTFTLYMRT